MLAPVLVADDHPLFRTALLQAVRQAAPDREIQETETLKGALTALEAGPVGLLTLDLHMPDSEGLAGLLEVRSRFPTVPVIVVSGDTGPTVGPRAAGLGAAGFVPKSSDLSVIREAIETVLDGGVWLPDEAEETEADAALRSLTPSQLKVLLFVRDGLLNKQIAYDLSIAETTVKAHVTAILKKLGVRSRTQAVIAARHFSV